MGMMLSILPAACAAGKRSIFFFVASFSIGFTSKKIWLKNEGAFKIRICTRK